MPELLTKPVSWFVPDPNQPRKSYAKKELLELAESLITDGQFQPVGARPDGMLIWGGRRLAAAQLGGIKELSVIITDRLLSDTAIRIIQLGENLHRSSWADREVYLAVKELRTLNPTWLKKDFAAHLHKDASMITRILSVDDLIPEAREAFLDGAFGFSVAYGISKATAEQQHLLLASKLSGVSRDEIERQGRKQGNTPDGASQPHRLPASIRDRGASQRPETQLGRHDRGDRRTVEDGQTGQRPGNVRQNI